MSWFVSGGELSRVNRIRGKVLHDKDNHTRSDGVDVIRRTSAGLRNSNGGNSHSSCDNSLMPTGKEVEEELCSSAANSDPSRNFTHSLIDDRHVNFGLNEPQNYDGLLFSKPGVVQGQKAEDSNLGCSGEPIGGVGGNLFDAVSNTTIASGEEIEKSRVDNNGEAQV